MLIDGKNLTNAYDNVEFNKQVLLHGIENQIVSFVPYPPVNALIMLPIARLEPLTAKLVWNILSAVFFVLSTYFISKISGLNFFQTGILFFASGFAFANNFFFGQVYLLVLLCFSSSIYFLMSEKNIPAAFLFSLSVLLKFYTIFFLLLFLFRKKFRMVLYSLAFMIVLNIISFIITGFHVNYFYYTEIIPRISDGWIGTVFAPEFQSMTSLLHTLFYFEPSLNSNPLIQSPELYFILKYFFYFAILGASMFSIWKSKDKNSFEVFKLQIALFCFVCMLLLPVNASYQYVLLVPAIAILINYFLSRKGYFDIVITLILFFIMNSPVSVYIVNITKLTSYFYLGYVKLFILLYFWIRILYILKEYGLEASKDLLRYSFACLLLISVFSRMSLRVFEQPMDSAMNLLLNPSYLISMPSVYGNKLVYTECRNERFALNSNFGFKYEKENVFDPEFVNGNEIVYETIKGKKEYLNKLSVVSENDTLFGGRTTTEVNKDSLESSHQVFAKDGHIFLSEISSGNTVQLTYGNCIDSHPEFYDNFNKIIFCSDRNRGVGFTTLYEINIKK